MTETAPIVDATSSSERIGRYRRSDLAAMVGKRGRKPPEFYEAYPEQRREPAEPKAERATKSGSSRAGRKATALVIDDDALAAQVRAASPAVRKLISDLLAVVGQEASAVPAILASETAAAPEVRTVTISEPVYADPEVEADSALAG
jgi:hypothetical protein